MLLELVSEISCCGSMRVCLEYRVLPGIEPGTSAWPGRGPLEHRTRCVLCATTSGPETDWFGLFVCLFAKLRIHYLKAQFSANANNREYFSLTEKVSANIIEWFKSEGKVRDSMVYASSVFANLEPSKVWLRGPILPCACCTSGRALTLFLGKVSLGSSTVRASTVPEGSSPVE